MMVSCLLDRGYQDGGVSLEDTIAGEKLKESGTLFTDDFIRD